MKLHQLKTFCTVVDHDFNISRAARVLNTSQPGLSAQLQQLEEHLGIDILNRSNRKITGLSEAGLVVLASARRMLAEVEQVYRAVSEVKANSTNKRLRIGTTHTHAIHSVRPVFKIFNQSRPDVVLQLYQNKPNEVAQLVASGAVDIGISALPMEVPLGVTSIPCFSFGHSVFVPRGHPLESNKRLSLIDLLPYPIITYDTSFRLGQIVRQTFRAQGIEPNIVISVTDSATMKAYVESELGIAILPNLVYDPDKDKGISIVGVDHLFETSICHIMTLDGAALEDFQVSFINEYRSVAPTMLGVRVGSPR